MHRFPKDRIGCLRQSAVGVSRLHTADRPIHSARWVSIHAENAREPCRYFEDATRQFFAEQTRIAADTPLKSGHMALHDPEDATSVRRIHTLKGRYMSESISRRSVLVVGAGFAGAASVALPLGAIAQGAGAPRQSITVRATTEFESLDPPFRRHAPVRLGRIKSFDHNPLDSS